MKRTERKFKKQMEPGQLAVLLRQVADALEGRQSNDGAPLDGAFNNFSKASLKFKQKDSRLSVKVKVEYPLLQAPHTARAATESDRPSAAVEHPPQASETAKPSSAGEDKPKYKRLKKRMKSTFKQIREALVANQMPPAEVVKSFLHDSTLMIRYPGYGDEFYQVYSEACDRFSTAFASGDLVALKEHTEQLSQLKSDCHKRYK